MNFLPKTWCWRVSGIMEASSKKRKKIYKLSIPGIYLSSLVNTQNTIFKLDRTITEQCGETR